jgi:AAA domain (dynein-related subfamily)
LKPAELQDLLCKTIPARFPVLITGAPGIGKSDIVSQSAQLCDADIILSHPAVSDPTDAKGLPWKVDGQDCATFLPFGELKRALAAKKSTVWFLDDLGQASPAVQASFMQLLLARRVNGHILPDCVCFVAATNRRTDRANVSGVLEPVKSRFASIVELETNIDDWCGWAFQNQIPVTLIAFLRYRPELLSNFQPTADLTNSPSPRTWANLAKMEALQLPAQVETAAMAGSVGQAAAVEYLAFRKMFASLTTIDEILVNPDSAKIPSKPDQLYAVSVGLASRANADNLGRIARFLEKLTRENRGEFAALTLKDAVRRSNELTHTDAFIRIVSGPLGKLINGDLN